eukprot:CAMPEP_0174329062 /NCGR_PEP_ID=MMETSP0810-20121108/15575_1 /TAXON_ID=73025 ORGANISM="Eutreptiella gymnastica-like, Strain CCMP1594" /NCGR_SAMPLE_ID=MMETSP0810 /ASSEMBLY_ACC=CAM_ASM_000659 /LENGTH=114 /DNA_ID=CAMNT_0015443401 /DNA_START=224 /DNA_END=566 /DNA_ORIENTATION=-
MFRGGCMHQHMSSASMLQGPMDTCGSQDQNPKEAPQLSMDVTHPPNGGGAVTSTPPHASRRIADHCPPSQKCTGRCTPPQMPLILHLALLPPVVLEFLKPGKWGHAMESGPAWG